MSEQHDSQSAGRRLRAGTVLLLSSLGVLAAAALLSQQPEWVERYYSNGWSAFVGNGLAGLSGLFAGSVAEVLILALLVWAAVGAFLAIRRIRAGRSSWGRSVRSGALRLLTAACLLAALFYLTWGLNYSRPPLAERLGWQSLASQQLDPHEESQELARLCGQLVEEVNQAYRQAYGSPEWQRGRAPLERPEIDAAVEEGYRRAASLPGLPKSWGQSRGPAKPARISLLMSYLGISGIYFPMTAEAHYNAMAPDLELPHIMAHEKAHQRGIAGEDEAGFAGFLACIESGQPYVRYSGLAFAQRRLLSELFRRDPQQARNLAQGRLPAVQQDISAANAFWRSFEGPAAQVGEAVNDGYLRFHGVEGGIESYRLSSRLLVLYARSRGGRIQD